MAIRTQAVIDGGGEGYTAPKVTPTDPGDVARIAMIKLQTGQPLNDAERKALGVATDPTASTASRTDSAASRTALIKLQTGGQLTDAEKAFLGIGTASKTDSAASRSGDYLNLGALGGLGAGVVAGAGGPSQYGTAEIYDQYGDKVTVYTSGPQAGYSVEDGTLVIQGEAPTGEDVVEEDVVEEDVTDGTVTETVAETGNKPALPDAPVGLTEAQIGRKSAYDLLYSEFARYGLGSLVTPLKDLIMTAASDAELTIELRKSDAYKKRFAANDQRIAKGLTALDEATYLAKEDAYQNLMRNYGLPDTYWKKGDLGTQSGFEQLIANDVSSVELEDRLMLAQDRVLKAAPEIADTLKKYYPDITNGDILAYALDPKNAISQIKRKVTAAEIGGFADIQGAQISQARAEELMGVGVTGAQAKEGYQTVVPLAERGGELAAFYNESPYGQQQAEAEVFGLKGGAEARKQRERVTGLEKAAFSGSSGRGMISKERAGGI